MLMTCDGDQWDVPAKVALAASAGFALRHVTVVLTPGVQLMSLNIMRAVG